jgi:putative oxidoreductase
MRRFGGTAMATGLFLLLARMLIAAMFLSSGYAALSNIPGTTGYFAGLGLPAPLALTWAVGLFETVAGILLVAGFLTRPAAALLAAFSIAASFLGHYGQGDTPAVAFMHAHMLLMDIAVAGGLIVLAVRGPGAIALDARRF